MGIVTLTHLGRVGTGQTKRSQGGPRYGYLHAPLGQAFGDIHAPFNCIHCGETKVMETDFYKLFEARSGRPWDRPESQTNGSPLAA